MSSFVHVESLLNIAGYVCYRFQSDYPDPGEPTRELPPKNPPSWICQESRGSLIYPDENMMNASQILEKHFKAFLGEFLSSTDMIFRKNATLVKSEIPLNGSIPEILLYLVRTRTNIRLKFLNQNLKVLYLILRIAERSVKAMKIYSQLYTQLEYDLQSTLILNCYQSIKDFYLLHIIHK